MNTTHDDFAPMLERATILYNALTAAEREAVDHDEDEVAAFRLAQDVATKTRADTGLPPVPWREMTGVEQTAAAYAVTLVSLGGAAGHHVTFTAAPSGNDTATCTCRWTWSGASAYADTEARQHQITEALNRRRAEENRDKHRIGADEDFRPLTTVDLVRASMSHGEVRILDHRPETPWPSHCPSITRGSTHDDAYDIAKAVARGMVVALGAGARMTEAPCAVFEVWHHSVHIADVISN